MNNLKAYANSDRCKIASLLSAGFVITRRNDEAIFHANDPRYKDCFVG